MITYFKDQNHESKKKHKNKKISSPILKRVDTFFYIAATLTSVTLSVGGYGIFVMPITYKIQLKMLLD